MKTLVDGLFGKKKSVADLIPVKRAVPREPVAGPVRETTTDPDAIPFHTRRKSKNGAVAALRAGDFRMPGDYWNEGYDPENEIRVPLEDVLQQMRERDPTIPLPRLVELSEGQLRSDIPGAADIRVLLPWRRLAERPEVAEQLRELGRLRALRIATAPVTAPASEPAVENPKCSPIQEPESPEAEADAQPEPADAPMDAELAPACAEKPEPPNDAISGEPLEAENTDLLAVLVADRRAHREAMALVHDQLNAALRERNEMRDHASNERSEFRVRINDLTRRLEAAAQKDPQHQSRVADLETQREALTRVAEEARLDAQSLRRELEEAREELEHVSSAVDRQVALEEDVNNACIRIGELMRELETVAKREKEHQSRAADLETQSEALTRVAEDAHRETGSLREQLSETQEKMDRLGAEADRRVAALEGDLERVAAERSSFESESAGTRQQCELLRAQASEALDQLAQMTSGHAARVLVLEEEACSARSDTQAREAEVGGLRAELRALREKSRSDVWTPAADVVDDENGLSVELDLPGVRMEDLDITMKDGELSITGVRALQRGGHAERPAGSFQRCFPLADNLNSQDARAKFEQGVLTIRIPRAA